MVGECDDFPNEHIGLYGISVREGKKSTVLLGSFWAVVKGYTNCKFSISK